MKVENGQFNRYLTKIKKINVKPKVQEMVQTFTAGGLQASNPDTAADRGGRSHSKKRSTSMISRNTPVMSSHQMSALRGQNTSKQQRENSKDSRNYHNSKTSRIEDYKSQKSANSFNHHKDTNSRSSSLMDNNS